MGDTLPSHFGCFDLRSRYRNSPSYAAIVQDVGRAFNWAKSIEECPVVYVTPIGKAILQDPNAALEKGLITSLDPALTVRQNETMEV